MIGAHAAKLRPQYIPLCKEKYTMSSKEYAFFTYITYVASTKNTNFFHGVD